MILQLHREEGIDSSFGDVPNHKNTDAPAAQNDDYRFNESRNVQAR